MFDRAWLAGTAYVAALGELSRVTPPTKMLHLAQIDAQPDPATWSNSRAIDLPLVAWVRHHVATTDLVVIGSQSVIDELTEADLVDEYRLLTYPTAVGSGRRLFTQSRRLELVKGRAGRHRGPVRLQHARSVTVAIGFAHLLVSKYERPSMVRRAELVS
jgi:hypothetical protein